VATETEDALGLAGGGRAQAGSGSLEAVETLPRRFSQRADDPDG
jgi:hypothetical protein